MTAAEPLIAHVVAVPRPLPSVLGVGALLKNTVTLLHGERALVSRSVGDLGTVAAVRAFEETVAALLNGLCPERVAHDLHPDFPSTRLALAMAVEPMAVQHHHAHVAAVMAEHGLEGPAAGLALDGFGLGPGNQAWGGELLRVEPSGYVRQGHLRPLRQPGGDVAARQPWRMGASALHALGRGEEIVSRYGAFAGARIIVRMLERGVNSPWTSSCGRLFDAACGLLGVMPEAAAEGQAPMALERLVRRPRVLADGWRIGVGGELDLRPLLEALVDREPSDGADLFHGTLTAALAQWAETAGARDVVLCGGCFFNRVLREGLVDALEARGLRPLLPRTLSPGDGAVSLGQAWAAALALEGR